jgi:hypothetical protein
MRLLAHTHALSFGAKSDPDIEAQTGALAASSSHEGGSTTVEPTSTQTNSSQLLDDLRSIRGRIAALDTEHDQADVRWREGIHIEAVNLYEKALVLRNDEEEWAGFVADFSWNGCPGWKPKPEDQHDKPLFFTFKFGYGAREEPERKRASKHAKSLQPFFDKGIPATEVLQLLRNTGGFRGEKRKATAPANKAQPVSSASDEAIKSERFEAPAPDNPNPPIGDASVPEQGSDTPDVGLVTLIVEIPPEFTVNIGELQRNDRVTIIAHLSDDDRPTRLIATHVSIEAVYDPRQE